MAEVRWGTGTEQNERVKRLNPRATPLSRDRLDKADQPGGPVYAYD
jgi:hypothetical protein